MNGNKNTSLQKRGFCYTHKIGLFIDLYLYFFSLPLIIWPYQPFRGTVWSAILDTQASSKTKEKARCVVLVASLGKAILYRLC